jgi:iron-sulfur cluster assembly accessory protein
MLGVTDNAVKEFKKLLEDSKASNSGIRVFASGGSCCGPSFGMDISEKGVESDKLLEMDGLKIFIDPMAFNDLENATIDFMEEGQQKGFVIQGLASSGCSSGCCS